jgi:putative ABC transport system permease protein
MFRIHFVSAIRTLLKNRGVSIINVCGLTMGLTAFLFIVHYLFYEISFDSFFPESKSIYRVNSDIKTGEELFYHGAKTSRGLYFACKKDVPGIEANGDAYFESCLIRFEEAQLAQQSVLWVDEGFEKVFPFHLTKGIIDFTRPLTGIIAESKVAPVFGKQDPIGKIMKVNEGMPVEITGVFEDLPSNTHLTADYFISVKTWEQYGWISRNPDWNSGGFWNYIKLKPGVKIKSIEETLTKLVNANTPRRVSERTATIHLQPVSDLHYIRGLEGEMGSQTNQKSLFFLFIIALLTILIAWINYVSLSTALASKRADEIGMRKLIGASKLHIWLQSFFETVILNLAAIMLSLVVYRILLNSFARFFEIPLSQAIFPAKYVIWSVIGIAFIGILLSSIYNTLTLVGLNPFNGKKVVKQNRSFQKGMVILQMALSIVFLIITLMVYKQILFMKKAALGLDLNNVITLNAPASLNSDTTRRTKFLSFRRELLREPEFKSVTANSFTPGESPRYGNVEYVRPDAGVRPNSTFFENTGDDGMIETFGLKLIAGRNFSSLPSDNRRRVLLNESSIKELQFGSPEEAIGKYIYRANRDTVPIEIIGVIADFHNEGLQKPIYPMIYNNGHPFEFGYYSVRLTTNETSKALNKMKTIWLSHFPSDPMDFFYAQNFFFKQYHSETRFGKFHTSLTILSITIACLGLFGLIVFYLDQKQKEIGLRKINGARVAEIMLMLAREFARWLAIAFLIAAPVAWFVVDKWLQNFAYKTDLSWWIFALAGFSALCIAMLTVSWQSLRAATRNPVEALRYE